MFLRFIIATMLLLGVLMAGFGAYFITLGFEAEGWQKVEGRVVSVRVRVSDDFSSRRSSGTAWLASVRSFYPAITYRWAVDGETYTGSRYRLGESHEKYPERATAEAKAATYIPGAPITVYYDSDHPGEAVLEPSLSGGVFVPLPMGLLFLGCGYVLFRYREALDRVMQAPGGSSSALPKGETP